LDFYCPEVKLALEIDGLIHRLKKRYDRYRQTSVEDMKIRFVRFTNDEIDKNIGSVIDRIKLEVDRLRSIC
jgi:very-short-patch-repair endonuclease